MCVKASHSAFSVKIQNLWRCALTPPIRVQCMHRVKCITIILTLFCAGEHLRKFCTTFRMLNVPRLYLIVILLLFKICSNITLVEIRVLFNITLDN